MKNKHKIKASVSTAEITPEIQAVAEKIGIILPSTHSAIFRTIYAPINEANSNGIRLSQEAVEKALPGLIGSQVNFEHQGYGAILGFIINASINSNNEIETIFTFAKNIYETEYVRALELMQSQELTVSFELFASVEGQEILDDGTVLLHDIDFQGQGLLLDETPAYKNAVVFDMAKTYRKEAIKAKESGKFNEKELICASSIIKSCDKILATEHIEEEVPEILWTSITTRVDRHIHVVKIDMNGDGDTKGTFGDEEDEHIHKVVNYQIQEKKQHAHRLIEDLMAKRKEDIKSKQIKKDNSFQKKQGGIKEMTDEQKKLVAELREEFGDYIKDISDDQLLDEGKIDEIRKAKVEADRKSELDKAQARVVELEAENAEMKATIDAKDSEIDAVRANAEKIGKLKVELKDNTYVADFKDEDYLDEGKVERAKMQKENDDLKAQNEELAKKNKEAQDKITASKNDPDDLNTGHEDSNEDSEDDVHTILAKHYVK